MLLKAKRGEVLCTYYFMGQREYVYVLYVLQDNTIIQLLVQQLTEKISIVLYCIIAHL